MDAAITYAYHVWFSDFSIEPWMSYLVSRHVPKHSYSVNFTMEHFAVLEVLECILKKYHHHQMITLSHKTKRVQHVITIQNMDYQCTMHRYIFN